MCYNCVAIKGGKGEKDCDENVRNAKGAEPDGGACCLRVARSGVDQGRPSIIITENNTTSYGHTFLAHGYEIGNNSRYIGYKDPADGDITYAFDVKSMSGSGDSFVVNNEDNTKYISRAIIKNIAA